MKTIAKARRSAWTLTALTALVLCPGSVAAQNQVMNPRFDVGVTSWFIDAGASGTRLLWGASGATASGGSGVVVAIPDSGLPSVRLQQIVTVTQLPSYRFRAVVRVDRPMNGITTATLQLRGYNGTTCNGPIFYSSSPIPDGTPWTPFGTTLTGLPGSVCVLLEVLGDGPTSPLTALAHLDNVYLGP
jgi:hypothetical protein